MMTMTREFRTSDVRFRCSGFGPSRYSLWVPRLGYDVSVYLDRETGELTIADYDLTPDERLGGLEITRLHLAEEHAKYLRWLDEKDMHQWAAEPTPAPWFASLSTVEG